jgi:predicted cupin superfamily sugar epimerase
MKKGEAKYEWKEKVWLIEGHKAVEKTVDSAEISLKQKCTVTYYLLDKDGKCDYTRIDENHIYPSKDELIKSL